MSELVIVGGGNMGEALLKGLLSSGRLHPGDVAVVEVIAERRDVLVERYPGITVSADMVGGRGALIAVKPYDVPAAVRAAVEAGAVRVLSIAAGVTIAAMEAAAGDGVAVVRAMPNTPALVGQGAAGVSAGRWADAGTLEWAVALLRSVGVVVEVPEAQLDAVTGLAGSGPAYVMLIAEALIEGGVLVGLSRPVARALATQLLLGSAAMLAETGELPEVLRANVTSPGGTTAAGLRELERHGVRSAVIEAIAAATERGRALGSVTSTG